MVIWYCIFTMPCIIHQFSSLKPNRMGPWLKFKRQSCLYNIRTIFTTSYTEYMVYAQLYLTYIHTIHTIPYVPLFLCAMLGLYRTGLFYDRTETIKCSRLERRFTLGHIWCWHFSLEQQILYKRKKYRFNPGKGNGYRNQTKNVNQLKYANYL